MGASTGLSLDVYGLSATQVLILSVILNPEPLLQRFKSLTRTHIAQFLGKNFDEIHACFNDKLLDAIFDATTYNLRLHKASIDEAMIASDMIPNSYGNPDRKLYYSLIGGIREPGKQAEDSVSRETKMNAVMAFMDKFQQGRSMKEVLNGRSKRGSTGTSGSPGSDNAPAKGAGESA